jgi:hypothetical protein
MDWANIYNMKEIENCAWGMGMDMSMIEKGEMK